MELLQRRRRLELIDAIPAFFDRKTFQTWAPKAPYEIVWWILATVVSISFLPQSITEATPSVNVALTTLGAAGCGWIWLFSRTLFRPDHQFERWNFGVIAIIIAVEATARLAPALAASGINEELLRLVSNAEPVVCISAMAFVFVEATASYENDTPGAEKRFRQIFMILFATVIAIAIIWGSNINETLYGAGWVENISIASGLAVILGTRLAVEYRRKHPLQLKGSRKLSNSSISRSKDEALARRILLMIENETFLSKENLKLSDMAADLGVHGYLVTQCITGDLGFRNFNHLINTYRITYAKAQLADPKNDEKKISSIAFDCGFNSIGTFNRAFKKEIGTTPREYRTSTSAPKKKFTAKRAE